MKTIIEGGFFMVKIFIDPGHGGSDPGAAANGLQEKDICLQIARKLQGILKQRYTSHQIKLSRTTDKTLTLKERTEMANRWDADYLVSIHVNAGGGTGFESYIFNGIYANKAETNRLRGTIHDEIVRTTRLKDRGKKEANFHMLRESRMPAILTENGFIDRASDAKQLRNNKFLLKIALAHAKGIAKAFALRKINENHDKLNFSYHEIQKGDTLWSLAKKHKTTVDQLMKWNHGIVPEQLQIGKRLIVGKHKSSPMYHTIEKGDTLWHLAIKYGTSVERLLELNRGLDPERLQIGYSIRIQ